MIPYLKPSIHLYVYLSNLLQSLRVGLPDPCCVFARPEEVDFRQSLLLLRQINTFNGKGGEFN